MNESIQANYRTRLSRYATLIHGNSPPGLAVKLAIYSAFVEQEGVHGDRLLKIEPLLHPLMVSTEVDLHLATAKLLEAPSRGEGSLFTFLEFCDKNRSDIIWKEGPLPVDVLRRQRDDLESHRQTIDVIKSRRNKFFAHLDRKYFKDPRAVFLDYPLSRANLIALVNCVISIIVDHQSHLDGKVNFHIAEFYTIATENMIRNLEAGRKLNFPGQLD